MIREIAGALRALQISGPSDVYTEDYTDILTFTFSDGASVRLEFEGQDWVTKADGHLRVDGLAGLRGILDGLMEG